MNPYTKAALFLLRMIAFGFVLVSVLQLGSLVFYFAGPKKPVIDWVSVGLRSIPLLIGLVLLIKSYAIARKLTEHFDE